MLAMGNIEQLMNEILTDLDGRGNHVEDWPADEAKAYRKHGGFQAGNDAVQAIRVKKAAARVQEVVDAAEKEAYDSGVSESQAMTGFTDETYQSILAQSPY